MYLTATTSPEFNWNSFDDINLRTQHESTYVLGGVDGRQDVNTGDVVALDDVLRLRGVATGQYIFVTMFAAEDDSPFSGGVWGGAEGSCPTWSQIVLAPRQWQAGGSFRTERRVPNPSRNWGGSKMTVYFDIRARPESLD